MVMKNVKSILLRIILIFSILIVGTSIVACSDPKRMLLQEEIEIGRGYGRNILLPVLVYTENSPIIFISCTAIELCDEISEKGINVYNVGKFLYNSWKRHLPIKVSSSYYQKAVQKDQIKVDLIADSIYRRNGIRGIIDTYSIKKYGYFSFDHIESDGYIMYLLYLHDIYLVYETFDEAGIVLKVISPALSDLSSYGYQ